MKKIVSILITTAVLLSMTVTTFAHPDITVTVDGEGVVFETKPEMVNERTMVPMRAIFEKLGAEVLWDEQSGTITATTPDMTVVTVIGDTKMTVNGEELQMDVAPYIKDDNTYVPVRFIAEALDCRVDWDQKNYVVVVSKNTADATYESAYNSIRDYVKSKGINTDGEWMYARSVKADKDMVGFVFTYSEEFECINIGVTMSITEGLEERIPFAEEVQTSNIINATISGEVISNTTLGVIINEENAEILGKTMKEELKLIIKDGNVTVEGEAGTLAEASVAFWNMIDNFFASEGCEVSVYDLGLVIPDSTEE